MESISYQSAPPVIRDYLFYIDGIANKSKLTVQEYYTDLRTFFRYIKMQRGLTDSDVFEDIIIDDVNIDLLKTVTLTDLHAFLVYCRNDRMNEAATRARKVVTLRQYFQYMCDRTGQLSTNPASQLESPRIKSALPKHLSLEQSAELLDVIDGQYKKRDYAIITLFLNCGLRLSELCGLNINSITSDRRLRVIGKRNKERVVYLNDACISAIDEYLKARPVDGVPKEHKDALFLSRLKRRISNKMVQYIVKKYLEKAGLGGEGLSVHKLRHTAATLMYQHGQVDIRVLKDILGHSNLGTTQIYTHLSSKQIEDAINANPLSKIKPKK